MAQVLEARRLDVCVDVRACVSELLRFEGGRTLRERGRTDHPALDLGGHLFCALAEGLGVAVPDCARDGGAVEEALEVRPQELAVESAAGGVGRRGCEVSFKGRPSGLLKREVS